MPKNWPKKPKNVAYSVITAERLVRIVSVSLGKQKAVLETPYSIVSYNRARIFRLLCSETESFPFNAANRILRCDHSRTSGVSVSFGMTAVR